MTSRREIERRLDHLEARTRTRSSPSQAELTAEQRAQIDAVYASLDADQQASLSAAQARLAAEPDDAPTGEFGLTDAEVAILDILTGGAP